MFRYITGMLVFVTGWTAMAGQPVGTHFDVHPLANGVYACIHKFGGEAICNAGVVDMGDYSVVIDPFMTPNAALELKQWIEKSGMSPVRYVVNTHYHNDHIRGNQVFGKEVRILSTKKTAELIQAEEPKAILAESQYAPPLCAQFSTLKSNFKGDTLSRPFQVFKMMQPYFCALARSTAEVKTRIPDSTFSEKLVLKGSRLLEIHDMGAGHTPSDAVVYLPAEKILFGADLITNHFHPYLGDGDIHGWLSILTTLSEYDATIFIPGHGEPGANDLIEQTKNYIADIRDLALKQAEKKAPSDSMPPQADVPEMYKDWWLDNFFSQNLRFAFESLHLKSSDK